MIHAIDRLCDALENGTDHRVAEAVTALLAKDVRDQASVGDWKQLLLTLNGCGLDLADPDLPFGELDSVRRGNIRQALVDLKAEIFAPLACQPVLCRAGFDADVQYRILLHRNETEAWLRRRDYLIAFIFLVTVVLLAVNLYLNIAYD